MAPPWVRARVLLRALVFVYKYLRSALSGILLEGRLRLAVCACAYLRECMELFA